MLTVAITGANRGIGLELAKQYADDGAAVIAFCRNPSAAAALHELASSSDSHVTVQAMDVGNEDSIRAAAQSTNERAIDILINNAGITGGRNQTLENTDTADWIGAFRVMAIGPFRVAQAFLPNLRRANSPKIMTVTSQIGAAAWPMGCHYIYASVKAAVNRIMLAMARDLKDEVIVTLIHPGWVKTDMGGQGADITAEESAAGIRRVIAGVTRADSGKFFKWNGDLHPW